MPYKITIQQPDAREIHIYEESCDHIIEPAGTKRDNPECMDSRAGSSVELIHATVINVDLELTPDDSELKTLVEIHPCLSGAGVRVDFV